MKNILLLHNGNIAVKEWYYKQYPTHTVMPCFTVEWPDINQSKLNFLTVNNNIICDITSADQISYVELCKLKDQFHIVKILSTYENDLNNLEDTWDKNTYDYNQWLIASMNRLAVADQIIFYNNQSFSLPSTKKHELIFSPGRCGTHVLREVINVRNFYHHHDSRHLDHLVSSNTFTKLTETARLFAILRKNFFKFTISRFAISALGSVMLSQADTIEQNKKIIKQPTPGKISADVFENEFNVVATFLDNLIGLKLLWQKDIVLYYLEDLSSHFNNIKSLKNPYEAQDIVKNYNEAVEFGNKYQSWYNCLLERANLIFEYPSYKILPDSL